MGRFPVTWHMRDMVVSVLIAVIKKSADLTWIHFPCQAFAR
jgi:hypothetical protein